MAMINIESTTWFDRLPTEIIFMIFNYLSSNDIIYTFFFFNQRLNNFLLQNERYLTYVELPTAHFDTWKNILRIIGSQIQSLNLNSLDLSFPLAYFPNLKSIIISSPCLLREQLKLIFTSNQFKHLHSFKLKRNQFSSGQFLCNDPDNGHFILEHVFGKKDSLESFQCSLVLELYEIDIRKLNFVINLNLHSLTLVLTHFQHIFILILYTPNLEYLNVQSQLPFIELKPINYKRIKLKKLYLKFINEHGVDPYFTGKIYYNTLINVTKMFTSSLTCLSLDFVNMYIRPIDKILFDSQKLQQLLEPLIQLKQFHLYARYPDTTLENENIISRFKTQYWFDHNWFFGMHGRYLYTLPFHFDYLYEFDDGFDDVKLTNNDILINNSRIWYYVKGIELSKTSNYNLNFVKELKMKMPKLIFIKFNHSDGNKINKNETDKMHFTLNNVRTIQYIKGSLEDEKDWLINALPNVTHLILHSTELPFIDNQLIKLFCGKIQRLDIDVFSGLEQLSEIYYIYFFNVQHISFNLHNRWRGPVQYANIIMNLLNDLQNLKTLLIYINQADKWNCITQKLLDETTKCLDMNRIMKNYQMKNSDQYLLFLKREYDDENIQNHGFLSTLRRWLSFSSFSIEKKT